MLDAHYTNERLAAIYDIDGGWSEDRDFYLGLAGGEPVDVLDIGCGTGVLANAYAARGHRVTGADPAAAMLDVARASEHGAAIEWIEATAQDLRSTRRFDLIVMTGHAFQVLLDEDDVIAAFDTIRRLLRPEGRFVFESRNPAVDWARKWNQDYRLATPFGEMTVLRQVVSDTGSNIRFKTTYRFADGDLVSDSNLRFWTQDQIRTLAEKAGLSVRTMMGDWRGGPFKAGTSEEMIFELIRAPAVPSR